MCNILNKFIIFCIFTYMNIRYILLIILVCVCVLCTVELSIFRQQINTKIMEQNTILYIKNAGVSVGIAPHLGGTIVFVSKNNSANILQSNDSLWHNQIDVTAETDFYPLQGHTVWVGPQSHWWIQQTVNSKRKTEKAMWPPDPFITLGKYHILSQNEWSVTLQSPHSDVWGITMQKEIAVNPDGSVFIQVTLINSSQDILAWDIWYNTRMPGYSKAYVKTRKDHVRVVPVINDTSAEMPYTFVEDYFTYCPQAPKNTLSRSSKAFIYPEMPVMYAFTPTHMLSISFEKHLAKEIHPEQGLVELYSHTEQDSAHALLELEYHSKYSHIGPGDFIQAWEVWTIEEYNGDNTESSHISFIKSL